MPDTDQRAPEPGALRPRLWRAFRLLAILAVAVGALSAALVARSGEELHIHMLVATALGTGFTVLVGGGLMTLVFMSASSGHDSDAAVPPVPTDDLETD